MLDLQIKAPKADKFRKAFQKAPATTVRHLNRAVALGLGEVAKRQVDKNFKFKTPRKYRTGFLRNTFAKNTAEKMATVVRRKTLLEAETRSTVHYADKVAKNNNYYKRILNLAKSDIKNHFEDVPKKIVKFIKDETK